MNKETRLALALLRAAPDYVQDARESGGNTAVGAVLSLPPHNMPRQVSEAAVAEALAVLDAEAAEAAEAAEGLEEVRLERSGQRALTFLGTLLAKVCGTRAAGKEQNRWHNLVLYRTAAGRHVVAIEYHTRWEGELGYCEATVCDCPEEIEAALRAYDPTAHVQGFPAGPQYEGRQATLLGWIRQRYDDQVRELLGQLPQADERIG